jgi:hypothetical protein
MSEKKWGVGQTQLLVGLVVLMFGAGLLIPYMSGAATVNCEATRGLNIIISWILTLIFMGLIAVVIGSGKMGLSYGILIDHRNKMSLARFQMVLWTFIIISAFITVGLWSVFNHCDKVWDLAVPKELWAAMGISTTALVGSPLIKDVKEKSTKTGDDQKKLETAKQIAIKRGKTPEEGKPLEDLQEAAGIYSVGRILQNKDPKDASIADLFNGEDDDDAAYIDLGKLQMFYFTLLVALVYSMMMAGRLYSGSTEIFPSLDQSMVALLGISNGGYLAKKAV